MTAASVPKYRTLAANMIKFPEFLSFEFGSYIDRFVKWLTVNHGDFFDSISDVMLFFLNSIEAFLIWIPWFVIVIVVFLLGWKFKSAVSGLLYAFFVTVIGALGLWELLMFTLSIVLISVIIALIIGIPVGILLAGSQTAESVVKPILDAMQTMPSFVYLIPAVMLFSLGKVPAVFATTIYALPPVIRLTNLAIKNVNAEMVEAARSFGATYWQTLVKVQLPQALPTIMTGINQTTMMAMSMVVMASMIGAKGLGMEVLIAINRLEIGRGFEAGLSIVIIAIIIDRLFQGFVNKSKTRAHIKNEKAE